jgi:steroid delta-isomerase-like uncharacterized protein
MTSDESTIIGRPQSERQMTRDEIVAFFDRRQEAYDNLDAVRLGADYAPDCIVDSPSAGTHYGRAAAQRVLQAVFDAFPDHKERTESLLIDGNRVARVLTIEGTDIGGFLGMPATGKPFRVNAVFVYELEGRQIVRERRIYDFTGLLVQIGVLKAKPV